MGTEILKKAAKGRATGILLCAGMLLITGFDVIGHDSPEHEIEALDKKIAKIGATAELLARRATEWRALGKYDEAARDLGKALLIKSNSTPLILEYASVELERGNPGAASRAIENGLARAQETEKAPLHMMMADLFERGGRHEAALGECEKAMAGAEPQLEWHLTRARLMARLGGHAQAAAALKAAYEKTPNVVLEIEWIEAMIDAGQNEAALERLARYTGRGRWRSAWLIRQARAELGLNRTEAAQASSAAALAELEQRINPGKVDATLLADRAMAHLLHGDRDAAAKDMDRIRESFKGYVPGSTLARLERMFLGGKTGLR
jgi:tetratricopeptide (TPR) repeat protein